MKKFLKFIGILAVIYIIVFACNKILSKKIENDINNSSVMEKLRAQNEIEQATLIMNSYLPKIIDDKTTAKKIEYSIRENIMKYYFQIKDITKEELNNNFEKIKTEQINTIMSSSNNKSYIKAQVKFEYIYLDSAGKILGSFTILPNEYL